MKHFNMACIMFENFPLKYWQVLRTNLGCQSNVRTEGEKAGLGFFPLLETYP